MSEIQLNTCPICGCFSRFEYGGAMTSGKRIVKVRCDIGCVEQVIFHCEEVDAAKAWNFRASTPEFRDLLDALKSIDKRLRDCGQTVSAADAYDSFYQEIVAEAIAKATGTQS